MDKKLKAILWITWGILTPVLLNITLQGADRAMYTGAKQAGRNRVAEYVK